MSTFVSNVINYTNFSRYIKYIENNQYTKIPIFNFKLKTKVTNTSTTASVPFAFAVLTYIAYYNHEYDYSVNVSNGEAPFITPLTPDFILKEIIYYENHNLLPQESVTINVDIPYFNVPERTSYYMNSGAIIDFTAPAGINFFGNYCYTKGPREIIIYDIEKKEEEEKETTKTKLDSI